MANYNFLSGSSIDTIPNLLFDILESETCYLGFAKGNNNNPWGINSLIQIEHTIPFLESIAMSETQEAKFYDSNSLANIYNSNIENSRVYITRYNITTDPTRQIPIYLTDEEIGKLYLTYINSTWAVIQGLQGNFYKTLYTKNSLNTEEYVYYIESYHKDVSVKINNKVFTNIPYISSDCDLYMKGHNTQFYVPIATNLQKTTNILGETIITGLQDPTDLLNSVLINSNQNKTTMMSSTFQLVSRSVSSDILFDNLFFVDPNTGSNNELYTEYTSYEGNQKFLTFRYFHTNTKYQYLKFVIGDNEVNSLAIWNEALPFKSINEVMDYNPPALEISYLKNTAFHYSIFDINGFSKITKNDITYVKELTNTADELSYSNYGFKIDHLILTGENINHVGIVKDLISNAVSGVRTIILYDYHSFVQNDTVSIPINPSDTNDNTARTVYKIVNVSPNSITLNKDLFITTPLESGALISSDPTNVNTSIMLATTKDKDKALLYSLNNIMIDKSIPRSGLGSPTDNIYRQLFISYKPKIDGVGCTDDTYNGDNTISGVNFNMNTWTYDNGTILYISNKLPVYRKWSSTDETFKIIL